MSKCYRCSSEEDMSCCAVCNDIFCDGCFRKRKRVCHSCYELLKHYRHGEKIRMGFYNRYKNQIDKIIGYDWQVGNIKIGRKTVKRLKKHPSGLPNSMFLYGNFWHHYSSIYISNIIPILGYDMYSLNKLFEQQSSYHEATLYLGPLEPETLYEHIQSDTYKDFSGWCIFMIHTDFGEIYFYMDMDLYKGCSSCDGGTKTHCKIRCADNLKALVQFCLDSEQLAYIQDLKK